jgi:hypothetical protein
MTNTSLSNNCRNEGSGIQRFEVDLLWVLAELIEMFAQSSDVFAQSAKILVQSINV